MEISDLICIGKLQFSNKVGNDKKIILKVKIDYQKFLIKLSDVFLIYKDHRVRYGKIDIRKVIKDGVAEVDFEDLDLKDELVAEDSASVFLDEDTINQLDDENIYFDPVGMKVIWEGEEVAQIKNFFFNGAHDVYEIEMLDKAALPAKSIISKTFCHSERSEESPRCFVPQHDKRGMETQVLNKKIVLIPDVESFVIETNIEERFIRVVDLDQFF